jgi:hypothetical protein
MDALHAHLILNHIPVFAVPFGFCVLLWGLLRRNAPVMRVGLVALVIAGAAAVPVYLTGEASEDSAEAIDPAAEVYIERHEDAAKVALIAALSLGGLAVLAGGMSFSSRAAIRTSAGSVVLLGAVGVFALMAWTANLGGQIRHGELRAADGGGLLEPMRSWRGSKDHDED